MQIFATEQIRAWDEYTIRHEPITSVDLMERAATACYEWLLQNNYKDHAFTIFCGKGNNGGEIISNNKPAVRATRSTAGGCDHLLRCGRECRWPVNLIASCSCRAAA